jgi:hypothetical protein
MPSITLTEISCPMPVVLCIHTIILQERQLFGYEGACNDILIEFDILMQQVRLIKMCVNGTDISRKVQMGKHINFILFSPCIFQ